MPIELFSGWLVKDGGALGSAKKRYCVLSLADPPAPPTPSSGSQLVRLYFVDPDGRPYDVYDVEAAAARELISVRSGCFCNPGDGEVAHHISRDDMERCFTDPSAAITLMQCQRTIEDKTGNVPNTIRVSLGLASDFGDVRRFVAFAESYRDRIAGADDGGPADVGGPGPAG